MSVLGPAVMTRAGEPKSPPYERLYHRQCVFHASFLAGDSPHPEKNYNSLQTAADLCALNIFFGRDNELQKRHWSFGLMDNKRRKLLFIKQSRGCKFKPNMHRNTFGGRAPPGPCAHPHLLASMRGLLLRGTECNVM